MRSSSTRVDSSRAPHLANGRPLGPWRSACGLLLTLAVRAALGQALTTARSLSMSTWTMAPGKSEAHARRRMLRTWWVVPCVLPHRRSQFHAHPVVRVRPRPRVQKKNLLTSPPKKGGFGFPGTTLGPMPAYVADPYDTKPERKAKEEDENARPPFKSASAPRATLDTPEHSATAASSVRRTALLACWRFAACSRDACVVVGSCTPGVPQGRPVLATEARPGHGVFKEGTCGTTFGVPRL